MRQETPQEKAYHDMLSPDLGAKAHVSFGHQKICGSSKHICRLSMGKGRIGPNV